MKKLFTLLFVFLAALGASATDYEVEAANIAAFNAIEPIGNGFNKLLTDGHGNTMKARDLFYALSDGYVWPQKASKITGLLLYYMNGRYLVPISEDAIVAYVQPTEVTFDFSDPNFRENIGESLTDVKGNIYNETFTADGATLQITCGSATSKIYVDANRGQNLVTYKEYTTLTFCAPEGYAITKIEFTAAGNSNINNFSASSEVLNPSGTSNE